MEKSEKIAGIISIIAIIGAAIFIAQSSFLAIEPLRNILIGIGIAILAAYSVAILGSYLILKSRIKIFNKLSSEFRLKHTHMSLKLFGSYGTLNRLEGNIGAHAVVVSDKYIDPSSEIKNYASSLALGSIATGILSGGRYINPWALYTNRFTEIIVDGNKLTPETPLRKYFVVTQYLKCRDIRDILKGIQ